MHNLTDDFLLDPAVVFLNHGSFGACPRPVFEAYQRWQRQLEHQPILFLGRRFPARMQAARQALGAFLGTDGDNLVYVPNTTTGGNMVARSLALAPGDEVLTTDLEYGAMDRMWTFLCEKQQARYVRRPIPLPVTTPEAFVETVWAGVTDRTRVLFLSHITSVTALTLPIGPLIRRAREAGILTVIDGAHAPGQIPLDLDTLAPDFYTGNCHKWLMAPKGAAFLYARTDKQHLIEPLVVSWGDKSAPSSPFIQENEFQGTRDIAAYLSVPTAIAYFEAHNWPSVQQRCQALVKQARLDLIALTGMPPLAPADAGWFQQMVAQPLPLCDGPLLQRRLYDEYAVEIPVVEHHGRPLIRLSVQGYNTEQQVATLLDALRALLPQLTTSSLP